MLAWLLAFSMMAGLNSISAIEPAGPPRLSFFESAPQKTLPPPNIEAIPMKNPTLHSRRAQARARAVGFIIEERFTEALAFIRRQSGELRDWPGLASLEAGLVAGRDPLEALDIYYRIINGPARDRHWVRALNGYRVILGRLSEKGDFGAKAKLIRALGLEWRNNEARALLSQVLAQENLPKELQNELKAFGAVLALRVGDFEAAYAFWQKRTDTTSLRWLSTLNLRQGKFEAAYSARTKVASKLKGNAQLRELERCFDILVKGGLIDEAEDLLKSRKDLAKRLADNAYSLGLASLLAGDPQKAINYFKKETVRSGGKIAASLYYQARAHEMLGQKKEAINFYRRVAASHLGYYRLLAEGRLATLLGQYKKIALSVPLAALLKGPAGDMWGDGDSLGYYMWLSDRLSLPWPDIYQIATPKPIDPSIEGSREESKAAIDYYLDSGDYLAALDELLAATETILPLKTLPSDLAAKRYILLAATSGEYSLAVKLLNRLKTDSQSRRWNHPMVFARAVLGAWRRHGLSPQLVLSVIRTESAFEKVAVSTSNARGLMQILPSTAARLAILEGDRELREEDLFDPDLNIRYGTAYLSELIRVFGRLPLALAAYNGGPFNINAYMKAVPQRPLDLFIESLPFSESSIYVKRVLESQAIYESAYLGRYNYHDLTAPVGLPLSEPPDF
ncbi:MAG: lytic transglycosylase domain-containing protein [Deltaproteobacteria bacterium]|jgi:soluble lytic murein transglycosylase-like protein|nr:lytic transglycosylase domain-containing protein [Deltaproteobacteria bacterium]